MPLSLSVPELELEQMALEQIALEQRRLEQKPVAQPLLPPFRLCLLQRRHPRPLQPLPNACSRTSMRRRSSWSRFSAMSL